MVGVTVHPVFVFPSLTLWPKIGSKAAGADLETGKYRDSGRELAIMRIVVTGASGRLGSELLDRLEREEQHEVFAWSGTANGRAAARSRCGPSSWATGLRSPRRWTR